ncbi:hypothetical protein TcWFU_008564 [Taenia crassiceps]|uniref:Uncharacterized protein n=1 Tax=Taenia crassiceps TaxID=6207 RepID=A0ABR4Q432_9CEST
MNKTSSSSWECPYSSYGDPPLLLLLLLLLLGCQVKAFIPSWHSHEREQTIVKRFIKVDKHQGVRTTAVALKHRFQDSPNIRKETSYAPGGETESLQHSPIQFTNFKFPVYPNFSRVLSSSTEDSSPTHGRQRPTSSEVQPRSAFVPQPPSHNAPTNQHLDRSQQSKERILPISVETTEFIKGPTPPTYSRVQLVLGKKSRESECTGLDYLRSIECPADPNNPMLRVPPPLLTTQFAEFEKAICQPASTNLCTRDS